MQADEDDRDALLARITQLEETLAAVVARLGDVETPPAAPIPPPDERFARRQLLAKLGAAGLVGTAVLTGDRAAATTGPMSFGTDHNAGTDDTTLTSSHSSQTFLATNTGTGNGIQGTAAADGRGGVIARGADTGFGLYARSTTLSGLPFGTAAVLGDSGPNSGVIGLSADSAAIIGRTSAAGEKGVLGWGPDNGYGLQGRNDTVSGIGAGNCAIIGDSGTNAGIVGLSGANTGVIGRTSAANQQGIVGSSLHATTPGNGIVGVSGVATNQVFPSAGVRGSSTTGSGVVGGSNANDGVIGATTAATRTGVRGSYGPADANGFGVTGTSGTVSGMVTVTGAGVLGDSTGGVGVAAYSTNNHGVYARSGSGDAPSVWAGDHGVYGVCTGGGAGVVASGTTIGLIASTTSSAWYAITASAPGLAITAAGGTRGVRCAGELAPISLAPSSTSGAPTSGQFLRGDVRVDNVGRLLVCTAGGAPGTWATVGYGQTTTYLSQPVRVFDSRTAGSGNPKLAKQTSRDVPCHGTFGSVTIPAEAKAIIGNLTITGTVGTAGYLTAYPQGSPPVGANKPSNINWFGANQTLANVLNAKLNPANGQLTIHNGIDGGSNSTHFIVDVVAYTV